jgi:hypothetical protein
MRKEVPIVIAAVALTLLTVTRSVPVFFEKVNLHNDGHSQRLRALEDEIGRLRTLLVDMIALPPPPVHTPAAQPPPPPPKLPDFGAADSACNPVSHAGFGGGSLGWGMTFKVASAQECCDACRAHARTCADVHSKGKVYYPRRWQGNITEERCPTHMSSNEDGTHQAQPCNIFVFCPTPLSAGGLCWSNDVWNHSYGEW